MYFTSRVAVPRLSVLAVAVESAMMMHAATPPIQPGWDLNLDKSEALEALT